jgi:hypothetical protein
VFVSSNFSILASPGPIISAASPTSQVSIRSQFVKSLLLLIFACLAIPQAFAACHAVSPSGSGSKTGADWNNAYAGLPSTMIRGDIYYLADGNYGNHLSLSQADSGTLTIELRKAQSYDNGSTCPTSIAAGWNTSTMGSSQAVWNWGSGNIGNQSSDYWIINGNGNPSGGVDAAVGCGAIQSGAGTSTSGMLSGPPTVTGCGIKIDDSNCSSTATDGCDGGVGVINGCGTNTIWQYVEWFGQGLNPNGNNNSETYFRRCARSVSGEIFTHIYGHNAGTTYITMTSESNATISYNYFWGLFDGSVNHGEALQDTGGDSGTAIHHNIFRDQTTNGDLVFVDPVAGTHNAWLFYTNVDFCSSGNTCRHNDGIMACINSSQTCTNFVISNNTIIGNITSNAGLVCTNTCTGTVQNNLYYNVTAGASLTAMTQDHNSFLNTSGSSGATNVNITSGAPNPFVSWQVGNVNLVSDSADWNSRATLGSPYNTADLYGRPFSTDRGASQWVSAAAPAPPTNLEYTVTQLLLNWNRADPKTSGNVLDRRSISEVIWPKTIAYVCRN